MQRVLYGRTGGAQGAPRPSAPMEKQYGHYGVVLKPKEAQFKLIIGLDQLVPITT